MPPLEIIPSATTAPPRGLPMRGSHLPVVVIPPKKKSTAAAVATAAASSTLIIMASSPDATARQTASSSTSSASSSSSGGSSPSSVTTVTTIESHSSSTQAPASRDLIGEYLAAKSRSQGPPAIFSPQVSPARDVDDHGLAYKHPILLMNEEDDQNVYCSVVSSVGNERNREVEVRYVDDNSIELLDAREDFGEGEKESLIVPKPKKTAFHSLKGSPVRNGGDASEQSSKCRLVGKVNPNILKTWEQLSGGDKCEHKRKNSKNSLITVTSSEDSKQSCLIFYRNQYNNAVTTEEEEFTVNRIQHSSVSTSSTTTTPMADEDKMAATTPRASESTTTDTTSSEGCYDFYDSIDNSSTRIDGRDAGAGDLLEEEDGAEDEDDEEEYAMAAGEGLADFTSLDRKKMMWSIDVE